MEKSYKIVKKMQYFLQCCCLTTLVLFQTDLSSRCLPSSTGHSSSLVLLVSLVLAYAFAVIFWWPFNAAAPNLASTQIPLAHHPDPQLKRLLCFSIWFYFSNGWQTKKTVDSPQCPCAHGCCSHSSMALERVAAKRRKYRLAMVLVPPTVFL